MAGSSSNYSWVAQPTKLALMWVMSPGKHIELNQQFFTTDLSG